MLGLIFLATAQNGGMVSPGDGLKAKAYRMAVDVGTRLGGAMAGTPRVTQRLANGPIEIAWPRLVVQISVSQLRPVLYFDSSVAMAVPGVKWFADADTIRRTPWIRDAVKKAVVEPGLVSQLTPQTRDIRNRWPQPVANSTVEARWTIVQRNGIPFHPASPPNIIIDFNSTTHRIAAVDWHLNWSLMPSKTTVKPPAARAKLASLFQNFLRRNGLPAFVPGKLQVKPMYVTDNGIRVYADGRGIRGPAMHLDFQIYRLAYVGTYGPTQIWLSAGNLDCVGGIVGPEAKPANMPSTFSDRADKG